MNGRHGEAEPGAVDWDLLADHLGGVPGNDSALVAERIAHDPAWAAAAARLSGALDAVATDLRALPEPGPMPADIVARLDATLRAAGPLVPATHAAGHAAAAPSPGHPGGSRRPRGRADRQRQPRRMLRWSGGLAVAAGLVAFAALGLSSLTDSIWPASEQEGAPAAGPEVADSPTSVIGEPVLLATGVDYHPPTLTGSVPPPGPGISGGFPPDAADHMPGSADRDPPPAVPQALHRLWSDPQARLACLSTVVAAFQPAAISIQTVDFARFQGEPALVMAISVADGTSWFWVAGPACGTAGADFRFQQQVD